MRYHESLRIRNPISDTQDKEEHREEELVGYTRTIHIPTIILTLSMGSLAHFIYNGDEISLYIFIVSALVWTMYLLDAMVRTEYALPNLEGEV
jgi:hypothetical protein